MTRVLHGSERDLLQAFLDQQRSVVLWKLDGLTDAQLLRPVGKSQLYLLGIVKHLAAAEQYWLRELFGLPAEPLSLAASDDLQLEPDDTTDTVLAYYERAAPHLTQPSRHWTWTLPPGPGTTTPSASGSRYYT